MIERPATHRREHAEQSGEEYLENLGLTWDEMRNKKVLDIGAMDAGFEHAARARGIDVTSIDKEVVEGDHVPPTDSRFAIAKATKLPFMDESFDYAIAHLSVMNYAEAEETDETKKVHIEGYKQGYKEDEYLLYIEDALREACRTLKPNGQFRFTQTILDEGELQQGVGDVVPEQSSEAYEEWLTQREYSFLDQVARRAGFRELQLVKYPESHPARWKYHGLAHYYTAIK